MTEADPVNQRWGAFELGCSAVDIDGIRYVLAVPPHGTQTLGSNDVSLTQIPRVLHGLCIITSDNPGGFVRPMHVNKERRAEFRAEMVSYRLMGRIGRMYPAYGAHDVAALDLAGRQHGETAAVEYGLAIGIDDGFTLAHALAAGHEFGQLAIYHLVPTGRRLLACAQMQRSKPATTQPVRCTVIDLSK